MLGDTGAKGVARRRVSVIGDCEQVANEPPAGRLDTRRDATTIGPHQGGTVLFGMSQAVTCWECEARTESAFAVTLSTPTRQLGTLMLCPACYHHCYLPLDPDRSGMLLVEVRMANRHVGR